MPESIRRASFHGAAGALFKIYLVSALLTIATLGIYSFWGKVRVRAYLYGQTELDGDRFAYHGTGGELFRGWLKAVGLVILCVVVAIPVVLLVGEIAGTLLLYVGVFLLIFPMALVGTRRYRLSRTSWRGLRFSFRGRWQEFVAVYARGLLLTIVTLGIYYPVFHADVRRFLVDHSYFGSEAFEFDADGAELIGRHILALLLTPFTLGLYWFWYAAYRHRYYWGRTSFAGATFESTMKGSSLCGLVLSNVLLLVVTLGLGFAWAKVRTVSYHCDCLSLHGPAEFAAIRQSAQPASATGEGLTELMDVELVGADFFGL